MPLMLHTHIIAAAKTIQALNSAESVTALAKLIIVNYLLMMQQLALMVFMHVYATELLTLAFFGMLP